MHAKSLLLASMTLLGSVSHAQLPTFDGPPGSQLLQDVMPGLPGQSPYRQVVAADIDGNLDKDIIYVIDTGLIVNLNVAISTIHFRVDIPCNDVAARKTASGKDELILAGPNGLIILDFEISQGGAIRSWTSRHLDTPETADMRAITSCSLVTHGNQDLLGIQSDGQTLVALLEYIPAPSGYLIYPGFSPMTTGTAWDVEAVDRDGNGTLEVGALTSDGLEFFDATGTGIGTFGFASPTGALCRVTGGANDQLAWVRPGTGGDMELYMATSQGLGTPVNLGNVSIVAAETGDLDADGDTDLALSLADSTQLLILENENGSFNLSSLRALSNGRSSSSNNVASPLLADLDGDGHTDVAWADLNSQTLEVFYNDDWDGYENTLPYIDYLDFGIDNLLVWDFEASRPPGDSIPADVEYLQVRVFHQYPNEIDGMNPDGWSPPQFVSAVPTGTHFAKTNYPYPSITIPYVPDDPEHHAYITYLEARFIVFGNGEYNIAKKYPPLFIAFTETENQPAIDYLTGWWPNIEILIRQIGNDEKAGGSGSNHPPNQGP